MRQVLKIPKTERQLRKEQREEKLKAIKGKADLTTIDQKLDVIIEMLKELIND